VRYEVEVEGRTRQLTVRRVGRAFAVELDGRIRLVDAVCVNGQILSLILGPVSAAGDAAPTLPATAADGEPGGRLVPGGSSHEVTLSVGQEGRLLALVGSTPVSVGLNGRRGRPGAGLPHGGDGPQRITAPMPGKIARILVAAGEVVHARQPLIVVEAMKMENELRAGHDGTVARVHVAEGASVDAGALLIDLL
jgi:biotin carboxyl carrier protein